MENVEQKHGIEFSESIKKFSKQELDDLYEIHPIIERNYQLPTLMMERCYSIVKDRVWMRRTGLVFYGPPRVGKTQCSFIIKELLENDFPKLHVTLMTARRTSHNSVSHICRLILAAEKHILVGRNSEDELFNNVITDIEIKLHSKKGNQFVLIIDEFHLLNLIDLQQLACIHNALEHAGIRMTTISFCQPEIRSIRTSLLASLDRQIIARFLSELFSFEGCANLDDIKFILRCYDLLSEFPENSGWSFTRFFAPKAFESGFRLENYASQIWAQLTSCVRVASYRSIPMEHTCLSVENILLSVRQQDTPEFRLQKSTIQSAITESQLSNFYACINSDGTSVT